MSSGEARRLPAWMAGSGVIAAGMAVMNISTYGFTLVAARFLGPREYGALAAVMGLMLVLTVVSLGLQATAARRVSSTPSALEETRRAVLRASRRAGVALAGITLVMTPLVAPLLRLDSWTPMLLLALSVLPVTVMGAQAGLLQGERRWLPLAAVFLAVGLGRLGLGLAALLWRADATGAMVGVAAGAVVPAVLGWWLLRQPSRPGDPATPGRLDAGSPPPRPPAPVLREVAQNSHALLAFFALSNLDVLIARSVLDPHQSGLYAGGLILAKAVLFLPQFVVVVAFPAMASRPGRRRLEGAALALVGAIGLVATLAAAVAGPLAVLFVGGSQYAELEGRIWAFAAVGTLLAMEQLLVYGTVARQQPHAARVLWGGLVLLAATAVAVGSLTSLLLFVVGVHSAVLAGLLALGRRPAGHEVVEATRSARR